MRHRVPAVLSDIDGVLYRGGKAIAGSPAATRRLLQPFQRHDGSHFRLPFTLLTNGGGDLECQRTALVNERMFGTTVQGQTPSDLVLDASQMICCHTPLRKIAPQYANDYVLVSGNGKVTDICHSYGFKKAIHVEELYSLMPDLVPLAHVKQDYPAERREANLAGLLQRFGTTRDQLVADLRFSAIMVMSDVFCQELNVQVMMDVLMSKDGSLLGPRRDPNEPQPVPFFITNPDVQYADKLALPRMSGQLPLVLYLDLMMKTTFGASFDYTVYGKPSRASFAYALEQVEAQAEQSGLEISNVYMIGDNPKGDILGANQMGENWRSILVRSGIYKPSDALAPSEVPTFEVADMEEAVKLIIKEEGL